MLQRTIEGRDYLEAVPPPRFPFDEEEPVTVIFPTYSYTGPIKAPVLCRPAAGEEATREAHRRSSRLFPALGDTGRIDIHAGVAC